MHALAHLWLPILVSAAIVFVLSAVSHMLAPWRRTEFHHVPETATVQAALRGLPPGLYLFPAAEDPRERMTAAWMEKWAAGPSGWLTLVPGGPISMGRNLVLSFLVYLAVSVLAAYAAGHALGWGAHYRAVFRVVGTITFLAYATGTSFQSIWYARPWRVWLADAFDALVFGLFTAGVFGWLWPR